MSLQDKSNHTVGSVAETAGVTVRTLHHYDQLGLLVPSGRSAAGYRLYQQADLERLQEILFYRELGLGLPEIARLMTDTGTPRLEVLRLQKQRLQQRTERLQAVIEAVDRAINAEEKGTIMTQQELLEVFDGFDPAVHQAEVEERWGDSGAFKAASRRTKNYKKEDWLRIKSEERAVSKAFAQLLEAGELSTSDAAADVAERHRMHIDTSYYPCSKAMHVGLGDVYVADPRFTAHWEELSEGLAQFVQEAIATNAMR